MKNLIFSYFLINIFLISQSHAQSLSTPTSDHIHIDQFGYLPSGSKVAVISDPLVGFNSGLSYTPGSNLQVINAVTNASVHSGTASAWSGGATHASSGDRGWWYDFSGISAAGRYFIYDAANNRRSYEFEIKSEIYLPILQAAFKMFYYNRCNAPKIAPYAASKWTDATNFLKSRQDAQCRYVYDSTNVSLQRDLSGGWWDAGDFNKYVTFAADPIHNLLQAYEDKPSIFGDTWNIPESYNGVPDIIDEIKWELDWLKKMQNANGSVVNKMGSIDHGHNTLVPPSTNVHFRYYGPTCTSSAIALTEMMSHASLVFSTIPALSSEATTLKNLAINSWNFVLPRINANTLETNCDDGTIKAGDADWTSDEQKNHALIAAYYLWKITNSALYHNYFIARIQDAPPVAANWMGVSTMTLNDVLMKYSQDPLGDNATKTEIINSIYPMISGDWNSFFRFNSLDLYRSHMPDWSYHWGSNLSKSNYANLARSIVKYNIFPAQNASMLQKSEEQLHYLHGVNPLNIVYLSNMYSFGAEKSANEIYHAWFANGSIYDNALTSTNGPAPGYLAGGPNKDFTVSSLSPPYGQPRQKSYLDFNTSFPSNSWEITEPAIYYQAAYIRHISAYVSGVSNPLSVNFGTFDVKKSALNVILDWSTFSEQNIKTMAVERSTDGLKWTVIHSMEIFSNSNSSRKYDYKDINPWTNTTQLYYRIKFINDNRSEQFSPIKSIDHELNNVGNNAVSFINLFPNPVSDILTYELPEDVIVNEMVIYQMNGQIFQKIKSIKSKGRIDLSNLPSGQYLITGDSNRGTFSNHFTKE